MTTWRSSDFGLIHNGPAYKPGGGSWAATSDARIKNELGDYSRGLTTSRSCVRSISTYKGNDTDNAPANMSAEFDDKVEDVPLAVPYPNSPNSNAAKAGTQYAGLIAQEVETVIPEMVKQRNGYIDGEPVTDLRDLDTTPLIFAMINAIKELKARIEVLEGTR